jgi:hypothetical protein
VSEGFLLVNGHGAVRKFREKLLPATLRKAFFAKHWVWKTASSQPSLVDLTQFVFQRVGSISTDDSSVAKQKLKSDESKKQHRRDFS